MSSILVRLTIDAIYEVRATHVVGASPLATIRQPMRRACFSRVGFPDTKGERNSLTISTASPNWLNRPRSAALLMICRCRDVVPGTDVALAQLSFFAERATITGRSVCVFTATAQVSSRFAKALQGVQSAVQKRIFHFASFSEITSTRLSGSVVPQFSHIHRGTDGPSKPSRSTSHGIGIIALRLNGQAFEMSASATARSCINHVSSRIWRDRMQAALIFNRLEPVASQWNQSSCIRSIDPRCVPEPTAAAFSAASCSADPVNVTVAVANRETAAQGCWDRVCRLRVKSVTDRAQAHSRWFRQAAAAAPNLVYKPNFFVGPSVNNLQRRR
jgi:hypothetical protein